MRLIDTSSMVEAHHRRRRGSVRTGDVDRSVRTDGADGSVIREEKDEGVGADSTRRRGTKVSTCWGRSRRAQKVRTERQELTRAIEAARRRRRALKQSIGSSSSLLTSRA